MSGFTRGPLFVRGPAAPCAHNGDIGIVNSNGTLIAVALTRKDETETNARLFANAHALFALAEKVARLNENAGEIGDGMLHTLTTEARQLIAQVTEAQS